MGTAPENRNSVFSVKLRKADTQADTARAGGKSPDLTAIKPGFHSWLSLNMCKAPGE